MLLTATARDKPPFFHYLTKKFRYPILGVFALYLVLTPFLKIMLHLKDYLGLVAVGLSVIFFIYSVFYVNSLQGWKKFLPVGAVGVSAASVKLASGWALASASATASIVSFSILISAVLGWFLSKLYSRQ